MFKYIDVRIYSLVKVDKSEIWKVGIMVAMRKIKTYRGFDSHTFHNENFYLLTKKSSNFVWKQKKSTQAK